MKNLQALTPLTTASPTLTVPVVPGTYGLKVNGTWGGGVLGVTFAEASDGTFVKIGSGVSASADGSTSFDVLGTGFIQLALAGSTGATVNCYLGGIAGRAASDMGV